MKIPIEELNRTILIEASTVKWFEASGNSTNILLSNGSKIVSTKILKHFDKMLHKNGFYRVHNKYLINLEYVESYSRGKSINVTMKCKTPLPVAVRRKSGYLNAIN